MRYEDYDPGGGSDQQIVLALFITVLVFFILARGL